MALACSAVRPWWPKLGELPVTCSSMDWAGEWDGGGVPRPGEGLGVRGRCCLLERASSRASAIAADHKKLTAVLRWIL